MHASVKYIFRRVLLSQTVSSFKELVDNCFPKLLFQSAFSPASMSPRPVRDGPHQIHHGTGGNMSSSFHSGKHLYRLLSTHLLPECLGFLSQKESLPAITARHPES